MIIATLGCNSNDDKKDNYTNPYWENPEVAKLLMHDELERSYYVFAPDNLSGIPLPVVLNFQVIKCDEINKYESKNKHKANWDYRFIR